MIHIGCCNSPLIFLSTRAAVETKNDKKVNTIVVLLWESLHLSQTTYEAVKAIVQREGVFGLYSGLGSSLWGIAITNG